MIEIGSLCVKTAGRDAMAHCVVVEIIDKNYVLIDGNVRRKRVNLAHIEALGKKFNIKKGAETKEILELLESEKIKITKSLDKKEKAEKKPQVKKVKKGSGKKEKPKNKNK